MKAFSVSCFLVLGIWISSFNILTQNDCVDLQIIRVEEPEWNDSLQSTEVYVHIRNASKNESQVTPLRIRDLDPDKKMLKKMKLQYEFKVYIERNRAQVMNDTFTEVFKDIKPIKAKSTVIDTVLIPNYWVYDPDCEIEVELDPNMTIDDCNRNNNWGFFASGF